MFILDHTELIKLTGKKHSAAQREALRLMGVPFGERPDGKPVVTRDAVNTSLGMKTQPQELRGSVNLEFLNG